MKQQILRTYIRDLPSSNCRTLCLMVLFLSLSVGCATAKKVNKVEDIRDDGKSNIVVLSYDMMVYETDKYPTEKKIQVNVYCPQSSRLTETTCFNLNLALKGRKNIDDYSMYAFEAGGTKVMRMKYGEYTATRASHSVLVDKIPDVSCYYSKNRKRDVCRRTIEDIHDSHRYVFPEPLLIPVSSGSGCYLGHFSLTVADGVVQDSKMEYGAELTPERLASISGELQAAIQQHVVRPCNSQS